MKSTLTNGDGVKFKAEILSTRSDEVESVCMDPHHGEQSEKRTVTISRVRFTDADGRSTEVDALVGPPIPRKHTVVQDE